MSDKPEHPDCDEDLQKPSFSVSIETSIDISPEDVLDRCSDDDVVEFIKRLDAGLENWDATLELADHFAGLRAIYLREVAEDPPSGGEG